jgi:ATP-dependent Lon protease
MDLHIHVSGRGDSKDGPSAGIAMATAIASELFRRPVVGNMAMSGEITLRDRCCPSAVSKKSIGGAQGWMQNDHNCPRPTGGILKISSPTSAVSLNLF